jgi:hypothetical protein
MGRCGERASVVRSALSACEQTASFNRSEVAAIVQAKLLNRLEGVEYDAATAAQVRLGCSHARTRPPGHAQPGGSACRVRASAGGGAVRAQAALWAAC